MGTNACVPAILSGRRVDARQSLLSARLAHEVSAGSTAASCCASVKVRARLGSSSTGTHWHERARIGAPMLPRVGAPRRSNITLVRAPAQVSQPRS